MTLSEAEQAGIFREWLNGYRNLMFRIVRAYSTDAADREDLFQEIAIQVWKSVPSFRGESAVSTWIYRIALNTAITWVKKERRRDLSNVSRDYVLHENNEDTDQQLAWLYGQIQKLNSIDRSIALLMLDGLSYNEMAIVLGISESNVGVKIHRLKKYLVSKAKEYYDHEF